MELAEAKERFVQTWGILGSNWGINRTMAQVHALLLVSATALSTEEVMEQLQISRGNANMNLRTLIDWGLVRREGKTGERREYFAAEKDMWKVFRQIVRERRKRELEPVFGALNEVSQVQGDRNDPEVKAFTEAIDGIQRFAGKADKTLETVLRADEQWFFATLLKFFK